MKKTRLSGVIGLVLLIAVIGVFGLFMLTACNQTANVAEIAVIEDTVPNFVVAGKFDLSGMKLLVTYDDETTNEVAVTSSMLTSDGRQALSTVGQQSVTIFYGKRTVVVDLLVVEAGTETVTVTFTDADGKLIAKKTGIKGEAMVMPDPISPDSSKVFAGWYDTAGKKVDLSKVEEDATLSARFSENVNEYEVKFLDYKGNVIETQTVVHGEYATYPTYRIPSELLSGEWIGLDRPITSDTTFNMIYKMREYRVEYYYVFESKQEISYTINNSNNAPMVESVEVGKNATMRTAAQNRLEAIGLKFISWQSTSTVINSDTKMIAIVEDRHFTVTYSDGKSFSYLSGTTVNLRTDAPQKEGYDFNLEWKGDDGQIYKGTMVVQKNVTLTPVYNRKATPVKVTFVFNGKKIVEAGGEERDVELTVEDAQMFFGDVVNKEYIEQKLASLKKKNDGNYDLSDYELQSIEYNGEDVTLNGVKLGVSLGYHEFTVIATNKNLPTEGLEFIFKNGGYYVSSYAANGAVKINVPAKYDDGTNGERNVIGIAQNAFDGRTIESIALPDTLTEVEDGAFKNTVLYGEVKFPLLKKFGKAVFANAQTGKYTDEEGNEKNYEITVSFTSGEGSFTSFDGETFRGTTGITKVVLPNEVTEITARAIPTEDKALDEIKEINLDNVTKIGDCAFANSFSLAKVGSLDKVISVGMGAFRGTALESLTLSAVKSVGELAFTDMENLKSLTLGTATVLDEKEKGFAFDLSVIGNDVALTELVLGLGVASVTNVNNVTVWGLKSITLGANVTEFTVQATALPRLSAISTQDNGKYFADNGVLYELKEGEVNTYKLCFYPINKLGDYAVPEKVNGVSVGVISDLEGAKINSLTLGKNVIDFVTASDFALSGTVTSVVFDFGEVKDYDKNTFTKVLSGLKNKLTASYYYLNVTGISDEAIKELVKEEVMKNVSLYDAKVGTTVKYDQTSGLFYEVKENKAVVIGFDALAESITVPETLGGVTVAALDKNLLVGNENIKTVTVNATLNAMSNLTGCASLENITFKGWTNDADTTVEGFNDTQISKNNNVFVLGGVLIDYNDKADMENSLVITAESLNSVTEIPADFFKGSAFAEVYLPSSVKFIRERAFKDCTALTTVDFNAVIEIGDEAFKNSALQSAVLENVIGMGKSAFENCVSLERVELQKKVNNGLVPVKAFCGCEKLVSVKMPEMVAFSETSNGVSEAFAGCVSLEDISFINSFAKIPANTFINCSGIKTIDFTQTAIRTIGDFAFMGCYGIEYLVFGGNLTSLGDQAFYCETGSKLKSVRFIGAGGLLANSELAERIFPEDGDYLIYVPAGEEAARALVNYQTKVRHSAPQVSFAAYGGLHLSENLMPNLNDTLYIETAPVAPTYEEYVFAGWYLLENNVYVRAEFPYNVTDNVCFYAKYFNKKAGSFTDANMELWTVNGINGVSVKSFDGSANDDFIFIPSEYTFANGNTYPVIRIDMVAFANWNGAELTIPEGVLEIVNSGDLESENGILSISLPATLLRIEENAFVNCKNVSEITFAENVNAEYIAKSAFEGTAWYANAKATAESEVSDGFIVAGNIAIEYVDIAVREEVEVPSVVTVLADELFKNNETIVQIRFSQNLRVIGDECFNGAKNLTYVYYANSANAGATIESIGKNAFVGTQWLTQQNMVIVGTVLLQYRDLTGESTVTIPDYITKIGENAFANNGSVRNIEFGTRSALTEIGDGAFKNTRLENIVLPAIEKMGMGVFEGCTALKTADLSKATFEVLPENTFSAKLDNTVLTSVILSDRVVSIGKNAFANCSKLGEIVARGITDSKCINESGILGTAFCNVDSRENDSFVIVGKILIKYIAGEASEEEVKTVTVPDGVEVIRNEVFMDKTTVNEVVIPASVKVIENAAFSGCSALRKVTFNGTSNLEVISESAFSGCSALAEFDFPEALVEIGNSAFYQSGLTNIVLGNSVTSIGDGAFKGSKLETVVLGDGIVFLGKEVFANCYSLYKVEWNWTDEVVDREETRELYSFDVLSRNIEQLYNDYVSKDDKYEEHVSSLFARNEARGNDVRVYFIDRAFNYVSNSKDNLIVKWVELDNIKICEAGDYPVITFGGDGYYMRSFSTEVITEENLGIPSRTGYTFMKWRIGEGENGEELVLPYRVYNDTTLTPEWFRNDLESVANNELGFTLDSTGSNYIVTTVNKVSDGVVLYIPSTVANKNVASIRLDETNLGDAVLVEKIVLTNSTAFDNYGITENIFHYFPNLKEITLLTNVGMTTNLVVEDGVLYSEDKSVLVAYLSRKGEDGKELTSFTVPDGVERILPYAFENSGLTEITVGKDVQTIGHEAFNDSLAQLKFAEGIRLTDATKESFENTVWYKEGDTMSEYEVDGSVRGVFYTAGNLIYEYQQSSAVDSLVIPDEINGVRITVLGSELNRGENITFGNLVLPLYLEKINEKALSGINVTKNITARGKVLSDIAENVFDDTTVYNSYNDMLILGSVLVKFVNTSERIEIPEGVVSISNNALSNGQFRSVSLPSTLKYIGKEAFLSCTNLLSVTIPDNVTEIAESAFAECRQLASVNFNAQTSKLQKIGVSAFSNCSALSSIAVPYTVESIGSNAFMNCIALTNVTFDNIRTSTDGNGNVVSTVVAKSRLTELGESAFYNNSRLVSVSIPNGITELKSNTFANNTSLVNVIFDINLSELRVIGENAFAGCRALGGIVDLENPSLVTLVLPNKLREIKRGAFKNCSSLLGVRMNYNVNSIESEVFSGCLRLTKLDVYASTPAVIASNAFDRNQGSTEPYYNLRIYVNKTTNGTTLGNYKRSWSNYSGNIYERNDYPTLKYVRTVSTGTGEQTYEAPEFTAEILIDPIFTWPEDGAQTGSWKYAGFRQRAYGDDGKPTGEYTEHNTIYRYDREINSLQYQRQKDERGNDHVILVLDYDEITLAVKN